MYLRPLSFVMALLASMGTILLGMGQRDIVLPILILFFSFLSIWITDLRGYFYLPRTFANVLMLLAAFISLRELFPIGSELQALGFARFLIYLQVIILFQKKDERIYWLLIMLSLLQVIVAALFYQGILFGLLLCLYMMLSFLALSLLLLHRHAEEMALHPPFTQNGSPPHLKQEGKKGWYRPERASPVEVNSSNDGGR